MAVNAPRPALPHARHPTLHDAAVTLARATAFLREQAREPCLDQSWSDRQRRVRSRVIGNWIGELDRLLHVLLDAAARAAGRPETEAQRNAAHKLAAFCAEAAWSAPRLHGLARARSTFRYTNGAARRADVRGGTHMTVGWSGPNGELRRFRIGECVLLDSGALAEICDLYDALAAHVVTSPRAGAPAPSPTRERSGHQGI